MNSVPIIVLRPQSDWHGDARIDLNREGLIMLQQLVERLLTDDHAIASLEPFASDGEGYTLAINLHDTETMWKLKPYYTGRPAEIDADRFRYALEQIQKMADLGNTTGITLEHAQAKLREIQRTAAEALKDTQS